MERLNSIRRLVGDLVGMWNAAPRRQALHWYGLVLLNLTSVLRTRRFYAADADMTGVCHFRALDQLFEFNMDDINSSVADPLQGNAHAFLRDLFVRRIYFRAFKQPAFRSCLDLGCNIGIVSTVLRQMAGPEGQVVAVDPLEYPTNRFWQKAIAAQEVKFERAVVCDRETMNSPERLHALCDAFAFDVDTAATIEQIMDRNHLERVDLLKMDIEGAEFAIFEQATPWLERVENIAMEVHSEAGDPTLVIARLQQHGFDTAWSSDYGFPVEQQNAAYIYASRTGNLKH
jgi:FkbM family methyltransferase